MRCNVKVMIQAWRAYQRVGYEAKVVPKGISWMVYEHSDMHFMKIMPENIRHSYVITFQASEQCKVQYMRQAQSIGWLKTS